MVRKNLSETTKAKIRARREVECFAICDRGAWFASLSEARKKQVLKWRAAWLNATETGLCPTKPVWINKEQQNECG